MSKLTPVAWKKFEKFLLSVGCAFNRQESSHRVYSKEGLRRPIIIQAKGTIPIFIILNNLRTLGIDKDTYLHIIDSL